MKCETGDGMDVNVAAVMGVLPCVDVEAVEAAESSEEESGGYQREAEFGVACDGWDEGGGGEADADSDLFGQAMGAPCDVNEDEVSEDEGSENEIEADGSDFEMREEQRESDGREEDSGEEKGAVAVVEVVAGFEVFEEVRLGVEGAGVHQTIGCVEGPDGESHSQCRSEWEMDLVGGGDEPRPESGDGGGVEGEKMPAG